MKELWLMCKSSLYCNFIDQNEQRINDGEIDLMYFPSDMLAFNSSKLPLDLHNEKEIDSCLEYAFGQKERLRELFNELANLNVAKYDKIGICIDHSANDLLFCNMIHYFVDADIEILYSDKSKSFVAWADLRQDIEENYRYMASSRIIFIKEAKRNRVKYIEMSAVVRCLINLLDEDPTSVSKIADIFKKMHDPADDINPRFIAKILFALASGGSIKAYKDGQLYTKEEISELSIETFLYEAKVKVLSEEEELEWLNEFEAKLKKMKVA